MSARLPTLTSTRRTSNHTSSRLKLKSTLPDSPFLPKLVADSTRSNQTNGTPENEPHKHIDPEQAWQKIHTKVGPISVPKALIKEHENDIAEHEAKLDALPKTNAEFIKNIDFFAKFLDENNVDTENLNEFEKFTRFCQVHGDFEKKQRLYYALIARRAVKLRQIDAVREELKKYETAARILDEMTANTQNKKLNETQLSAEFSRIIAIYTEKSFHLCSLKSQEEHVSTKFRLLKAKADRNADREGEARLIEEQMLQKRYIAILDAKIYELVGKK